MRAVGFDVSCFSFEEFQNGELRASPSLLSGADILYRGWMLSRDDYQRLQNDVAKAGAQLMIDCAAYIANHHLPEWYSELSGLTPETRIYPPDCDLEKELHTLGWEGFFIKDYVKSLKTSAGARVSKPEQVSALIADMRRFRGTIEGGFCVRRFESFLPDTERRFFVVDGIPHASSGNIPLIVQECVRRHQSRFYSVDVIQRADGEFRIVEVGDGQVSDLVGWEADRFAAMLKEHFQVPK